VTLNQIVAIMDDTTFQQQVRVAAIQQALVVLNEAVPANTIVETLRQQLAQTTIADGCSANLPRFVGAIANSNAGTFVLNDATDQNDAMIQSAFGNLWTQMSLATNMQVAQLHG